MKLLTSAILALCVLNFASAFIELNNDQKYFEPIENIEKTSQHWFTNQVLDHFSPLDHRTFAQRYFVDNQFFNPKHQRVMIYICGEGPCSGTPTDSYVGNVAQATQSLLVALEHRFYGLSVPFGANSLQVENLRYLSVEQGLADLAYFIDWFKNSNSYNVSSTSNWVVVGGSYAGAMSAWFRLKYPQSVIGSWASSAVINAITNFIQYDYQVFLSTSKSGPWCAQGLQNFSNYLNFNLYQNGTSWAQQFKAQWGAPSLSNEEFLSWTYTGIATLVQYSNRTGLCDIVQQSANASELISNLFALANEVSTPYSNTIKFLANTTWDSNTAAARLWTWQTCIEVGWFQGANPTVSQAILSQNLNISFFNLTCQVAFGNIWPNSSTFNNEFGGADIVSSNTVIVDGGDDPWQWASNIALDGPVVSLYNNCTNCGHCRDLYPPANGDPSILVKNRGEILILVKSWFEAAEAVKEVEY
jgi:hypothetical protein